MLKRHWFTWANLITLSGIIAIGLAIWAVSEKLFLLGAILYIYSALSDFFDGRVARWQEKKYGNGISKIGEILDPVRDKSAILILVTVSLKYTLIAVAFEIISIFYSYLARKRIGHHLITKVSKVVTSLQFLVILLIILLQIPWLFVIIYLLTGIRIWSYARKI